MTESIAPGFLVAVPQLTDPNFRQSVVLVLEQGTEGAMGLVVNRESKILLRELCADHSIAYQGDPQKLVRTGGPVQPEQGIVLYGAEHLDPDGRPVVEGLHVSASAETLGRLCTMKQGRFHCYTGYAGWAPGQLESELDEGAWLVVTGDASLVLDCPPEEMWARALHVNGIDPAAIVAGGHEA